VLSRKRLSAELLHSSDSKAIRCKFLFIVILHITEAHTPSLTHIFFNSDVEGQTVLEEEVRKDNVDRNWDQARALNPEGVALKKLPMLYVDVQVFCLCEGVNITACVHARSCVVWIVS